ncbi:Flavin prenyltransferase UbiX [Gammaproteobacteria bacterium]
MLIVNQIEMTISLAKASCFANPIRTVVLAYTGASGALYGLRLLECLIQAGCRVYLTISPAARVVFKQELDISFSEDPEKVTKDLLARYDAGQDQLRVFGHQDWFSPLASGSNPPDAMVICPCSMGTIAAIASGVSENLIERAADVCLKEKRHLVLVPRESPLSVIHLENMLRLARLGVVILPPAPGFYHKPTSISDLLDFVVARILDHLKIDHQLLKHWGMTESTRKIIT